MKLEAYQTLHCDAGWRRFSFLKLIAEDGTTGISEYNECYGSPGLTGVIEGVLEWIIGKNPFSHEKLSAELYARTRQAHGGIAQQAIAAVEKSSSIRTEEWDHAESLGIVDQSKEMATCYAQWSIACE